MSKRQTFESQLTRLSLITSVPLLLILISVMIFSEISIYLILLVAFISCILITYCNFRIYQKSEYQFRSLSNLLEAMTQGDYSLRARSAKGSNKTDGALDELVDSINGLANRLSQQRIASVESQLLLNTVIEHIDVAILALTEQNEISFVNPAAEKLLQLGQPKNQQHPQLNLVEQLISAQKLSAGRNQVVELLLGPHRGKFNLHIEEFRQTGKQHKLLFITDVRTLLRSEERKAWQSMVRVISHEINNSLSPIASISQTLKKMITVQGHGENNNNDLVEGLSIIGERANSLGHFVNSYKQLSKLAMPAKKPTSILDLLNKITLLFESHPIKLLSDFDIQLLIDPVQFEQVLINLIKNAIESTAQINSKEAIEIDWLTTHSSVNLKISDHGAGINNPENLFVPFYTTKKQGSGIGLVLSRQIIEAHNGQLMLVNRTSSQGSSAIIEIPLAH